MSGADGGQAREQAEQASLRVADLPGGAVGRGGAVRPDNECGGALPKEHVPENTVAIMPWRVRGRVPVGQRRLDAPLDGAVSVEDVADDAGGVFRDTHVISTEPATDDLLEYIGHGAEDLDVDGRLSGLVEDGEGEVVGG